MLPIHARKSTQTKMRVGLTIAVLMSILLTTAAAAAGGEPVVTAERLEGTKIGIKIEFPNEISGEFAGFMWGKYFDCATISSHVVYCIGPMASWVRSGLFYLYSNASKSVVLIKLISVTPAQQEFVPTVQTCPPQECAPR
jgi:hypothetical protein